MAPNIGNVTDAHYINITKPEALRGIAERL
jgi:hypothetical protein